MNILALGFMQEALFAALVTGLAAPAVGTYLVQRRLALLGDGIGHIAVTGVALGLLTGQAPMLTAVVVAVLGALTIELIRARGRTSGDVALALLFYGGIAGGVLMITAAGGSAAELQGYLFGSILTVSTTDLVAVGVLALVVAVLALGLAPQLFAVCQDEDFARVQGLSVRVYNVLLAIMAAVTVTVAMRTVGLLLVSALMVIPAATAQQLARGFRLTLLASMAIGAVAGVSGVLASFYAETSPGPTIVVLALAGFVATWPIGAVIRYRQRLRAPFEDTDAAAVLAAHTPAGAHPHQHGENCGHPAVRHGDHVDYVHHGHRHASHGDHYDEH